MSHILLLALQRLTVLSVAMRNLVKHHTMFTKLRLFKGRHLQQLILMLSVFSVCLFLSTQQLSAQCTRTTRLQSIDNAAAAINISQLNLPDPYLQPVGSVVSSKTVMPPAYNFLGAQGSTVLWQCDEKDLNSIYFLVATNGDDRVGGYWDLGSAVGLEHVYATWWQYIGIRQSMAGITLTRNWQKVPIQSYLLENNKISIRVMDIPPLEVSLIRLNQLPPESGSGSNECDGMGQTGIYTCTQPSSYIQLSGDSNVSIRFNHDQIGEDSNTNFMFLSANNGFGFTLRGSGPLQQSPSCVVRSASPLVQFPLISAGALNQGQTTQANFNVQLECSNDAKSGTERLETAISFQMSAEAHRAAQALDLLTANDTSAFLVSETTEGDKNLATGLGMRLQNNANAKDMLFTSPLALIGGGEISGWYPVLDGNPTAMSSRQNGYQLYQQSYRAILQALPSKTVTPGLFKATATVVVKIQ